MGLGMAATAWVERGAALRAHGCAACGGNSILLRLDGLEEHRPNRSAARATVFIRVPVLEKLSLGCIHDHGGAALEGLTLTPQTSRHPLSGNWWRSFCSQPALLLSPPRRETFTTHDSVWRELLCIATELIGEGAPPITDCLERAAPSAANPSFHHAICVLTVCGQSRRGSNGRSWSWEPAIT